VNRPIKSGAHGAIDYGFLALNLSASSLLGLNGPARALAYLFGGAQGSLNAVTDQPLALRRIVPFGTHCTIELSGGPLFVALPLALPLALPWLTGALKEPEARAYFLILGAVLVAVYGLTDWEAQPDG
jgi:hypothetical protein